MDTTTLIDSLIQTYKELNMRYRPLGNVDAALPIVSRMRDDEVQFSKALKDRLTGIGTADSSSGNAREALGVAEDAEIGLSQVISEFGTARATTLNLLRSISNDSVWQSDLDDGTSLFQRVSDLVRNDTAQLQRLSEVVGH